MPRMARNKTFMQMRVSKWAHDFLYSMKHGSAEQLDAVLDRVLGEYRNSDIGEKDFLYQEQVKCTQSWMHRALAAEERLKSRNMILEELINE